MNKRLIILLAVLGAVIGAYIVIEEQKLFPSAATPYKALVMSSASAAGVPWQLIAAEIEQESAWNPTAYNQGSGASGIAQFEPATASSLGVDPWDPESAIPGMANYLASLNSQLSGAGFPEWSYTLAAYDWGIGNVLDALNAGTPPNQWPGETRQYVANITANSGIDKATAALFA